MATDNILQYYTVFGSLFSALQRISHTIHYVTLLLIICIPITTCTVYRVDPSISFSGSGASWSQAFKTFDEALFNANKPVDEIWLKGGYTYYPLSNDRSSCFVAVTEKIKVYGGFNGHENSPSERHIYYPETILSGDINTKNDKSDNCYHVLTFTTEITIDRVTISDGNANYKQPDGYFLTTQINGNSIHRYGGALIAHEKGDKTQMNMYLNDVIFSDNQAINGGALWIKGRGGPGGLQMDVKISNCMFENNKAINGKYEGGYGGAIYTYLPGVNVNISDTLFIGNYGQFRGGALYQDYGAFIHCDRCIFDSNIAGGYGGALFTEDRNSQFAEGTIFTATESSFRNNTATHYGGAVLIFNGAQGNFHYNEFKSNTATRGGAMALFNSDNATFRSLKRNTYHFKDDDIYTEDEFFFQTIDYHLSFDIRKELSEVYGTYQRIKKGELDVLKVYENKHNKCYVDHKNMRLDQNGSSWTNAYNDLQLCIDFLKHSGGEIWVTSGKYVPSRIPNGKASKGMKNYKHQSFELYANISIYGGFLGIELSRNERNFSENPTYLSCHLGNDKYCTQILLAAENTLIDGFVFLESGIITSHSKKRRLKNSITVNKVLSGTSTTSGSGIYSNNTNIHIANTIFYKLFAAGKGGAVYCIGLSGSYTDYNIKSPTFINVKFLGNRAATRGGAISADVECNFVCKFCTFDSNSCSKKGGSIYLDFDSDPIITASTFRNNYALESGGCLAADGKSLTTFTSHTIFSNNYALWEGGCLYSGSGVDLFAPQMPTTQGFFFEEIPTFDNNYIELPGDRNSLGVGQNNLYGWPYTIVEEPFITESPTTGAPTSPTTEPTNHPTSDYSHIKKPNFLIYIVDDMSFKEGWVGYGAPEGINLLNKTVSYTNAPTPYIDEFMKDSVVFERSYSGSPKCSPSRFSILTGRQSCRSQWAKMKTLSSSSGVQGVEVSITVSKLYGWADSTYNVPFQLKYNSKNAYSTGMVGKWHLMTPTDNDHNIGCDKLDKIPDAALYKKCTDIIKDQGFDFADAVYMSNIYEYENIAQQSFSHNPEWMVSESIKFIDNAVNVENKNFYLYYSSTLTHTPSIETALKNCTKLQSPKGILTGKDIPRNTGMLSRDEIWDKAMRFNSQGTEKIAGYLWMDEQFGALIKYLKSNNLYDNTFIIFTNDHGMAAKGMLYEQGSRVMQIIRYPPKFQINDGPYVVSDDLVVSHIDIASVVFDLAKMYNPYYILDGRSWVSELQNEIYNKNKRKNTKSQYLTYMDMYNSHSIITSKWKYIFRATDEIELVNGSDLLYPYVHDIEQLYNLQTDPDEQNNLIDTSKRLRNTQCFFKNKMVDYINTVACPIGTNQCILPNTDQCIRSEIDKIEDIDKYNEENDYESSFNYKTILSLLMKSLL